MKHYNEFDETQQDNIKTLINTLKTELDNKKDKLLENCQKSRWDIVLTLLSVLFILAGIATIAKLIIMFLDWENFSMKDRAFTIIDTFFTALITAYLATKFLRDCYTSDSIININKADDFTQKTKQKALTIICEKLNQLFPDSIEQISSDELSKKYDENRVNQLIALKNIFNCVPNDIQSTYKEKVEDIKIKIESQNNMIRKF